MKTKCGCITRITYEILSEVFDVNPSTTSLQEILKTISPVIRWSLYRKGGNLPEGLNFEISRDTVSQTFIISIWSNVDLEWDKPNTYLHPTYEGNYFMSEDLLNRKGF